MTRTLEKSTSREKSVRRVKSVSGVPQGSVLGPFTIYLLCPETDFHHFGVQFHFYIDDSFSTKPRTSLSSPFSYLHYLNQTKLSDNKMQVFTKLRPFIVSIDGCQVHSVKSLGIILDNTLSSTAHISNA